MKLVRIYSNEHGAWWRPYYCGYTNDIAKAGIFEYEDALEHYPRMSYNKEQEDYFIDVESSELEDMLIELENKKSYLEGLLEKLKEEK